MLTFKLVIIGNKSVGKTSLVKRYTDNTFTNSVESTIGAQFCSKIVVLEPTPGNEVRVKLQIWDTAGEEKFRSITPMYYKNANAVVLVYDVTNEGSFESLSSWYQEVDDKRGADELKLAIAANKCDMAEYQEVPME